MKIAKYLATLILLSLLTSCATQTPLPHSLSGNADNLKGEYFPIEPLIAKSQVEITENGRLVVKDIRTLTNTQKLDYLGDTK